MHAVVYPKNSYVEILTSKDDGIRSGAGERYLGHEEEPSGMELGISGFTKEASVRTQ